MAYYETRKQRKRRAYHPDDMTADGRKRKAMRDARGSSSQPPDDREAMTAWLLQIAIEAYVPTVDRSGPPFCCANGDTYSSHTL